MDKQTHSTLKARNADYTKAYLMLKQSLLSYLRSKLDDYELAEDIVHEAFLRALSSEEKNKISDLNAWLKRVVHNALVDHYRRKVKGKQTSSDELIDDEAQSHEEESLGAEVHHIFAQFVRPFVDKLPNIYAQAIELKDYEGMSVRAIATELKVSESAVKSRLARGRQLLRKDLQACCEIELESGFVSNFRPKC